MREVEADRIFFTFPTSYEGASNLKIAVKHKNRGDSS